jgi:hypothetical protein
VGGQYIVVANTKYRFCGKDSIGSVWLETPANMQAVIEAIPIPVAQATDPPSVERREATSTWNWRYDPRRFTGTVGLSAVVTQGGYPVRVEITSSLFPELDTDVAAWVRSNWHFRPAVRDHHAVPVEVVLSIRVANGVPEGMN